MQGLLIHEIPSFVINLKTYDKHNLKKRKKKQKRNKHPTLLLLWIVSKKQTKRGSIDLLNFLQSF